MLCEDEADRESSTESSLEASYFHHLVTKTRGVSTSGEVSSVQDHSLGYFGESQGLWKKQHDC